MEDQDIMIDFDRLAQAVSPKSSNYQYPDHVRELVRVLRLAAIQHVEQEGAHGNLWIIETALRDGGQTAARYRRLGSVVIELNPGMAVCLERAQRERPREVEALVREWYGEEGQGA